MTDKMSETLTSFSAHFPDASEQDWLDAVSKALKGAGLERITRQSRDGISIRPLYRESDFPSHGDPRGAPGAAPFLRGAKAEPDTFLPWDIRQTFTAPDPETANAEILRDLERGVSSIELSIECEGQNGIQLSSLDDVRAALNGVHANIATVALDHRGVGTGSSAAALLALWAEEQAEPKAQKFAFNIDPIGLLMRKGKIAGGAEASFRKVAALTDALSLRFPHATALRVDARPVHEAGGTEAQELGTLMAHAVETLRQLSSHGISLDQTVSQLLFTLSVDANYGLGIAKLRAARRLWARVLEAFSLDAAPMKLQAVSSARMLTRYDPWVNMLRGTAACFAGAVGGADIVTLHPFNAALGQPEELGRRIARNTQIIAMEESGLGRIADPSGGAWFTETVSEDLASAAWSEFQAIESEGGLLASLTAGALQGRIAEARKALEKDVARRKIPVTGISEFPLLDGYDVPVAEVGNVTPKDGVDDAGLKKLLPGFAAQSGEDSVAEALTPIKIAAPFEDLRARADQHAETKGKQPSIFLATLGPLAEHTARLDFARNFFAAGGLEGITVEEAASVADGFKASGCQIAVLCGSDARYAEEAETTAKALKAAGAVTVWLAGKHEADNVDRHIFMGCDVVHELTLALADLGVAK